MSGRYFDDFFARWTCGSARLWVNEAAAPGQDDTGLVVTLRVLAPHRECWWQMLTVALPLI